MTEQELWERLDAAMARHPAWSWWVYRNISTGLWWVELGLLKACGETRQQALEKALEALAEWEKTA